MTPLELATIIGLDGHCAEAINNFALAHHDALAKLTPGQQAEIAYMLSDLADAIMADAKRAAESKMGQAKSRYRSSGVKFKRVPAHSRTAVIPTAVRARHPFSEEPDLYATREIKETITAERVRKPL